MGSIERVKKYLKEYNHHRQAILNLTEILEHMDGQRAITYNTMPKGNKLIDITGALGIGRAEAESNLKESKMIVGLVDRALVTLRPDERKIIELRYILDMSLNYVAVETYMSDSRVSQICKRALEKLAKTMFGKCG